MAGSKPPSPDFLDDVVAFPDGKSYALLRPLTDYRACHDGVPLEARILYLCKESDKESNEEYVVKLKVQYVARSSQDLVLTRPRLPVGMVADQQQPQAGPSTTTALELKALESFRKANSTHTPKLLGFKQAVQASNGPLPGGYITYTLMTKVPGETLFDLHFWALPTEERQDITQNFLNVLRCVYEDLPRLM